MSYGYVVPLGSLLAAQFGWQFGWSGALSARCWFGGASPPSTRVAFRVGRCPVRANVECMFVPGGPISYCGAFLVGRSLVPSNLVRPLRFVGRSLVHSNSTPTWVAAYRASRPRPSASTLRRAGLRPARCISCRAEPCPLQLGVPSALGWSSRVGLGFFFPRARRHVREVGAWAGLSDARQVGRSFLLLGWHSVSVGALGLYAPSRPRGSESAPQVAGRSCTRRGAELGRARGGHVSGCARRTCAYLMFVARALRRRAFVPVAARMRSDFDTVGSRRAG